MLNSDFVQLKTGLKAVIDYRGKTPPKSKTGYLTISAANVKAGRLDFSSPKRISVDDYRKWTTRGFTEPGDVLITTEAPVGELALYPEDGNTYLITRRVIALRVNPEVLNNKYLFYYLQSRPIQQELLSRSGRGSTVPRVLKPDILELKVPNLSILTQARIAGVLAKLDLLRRQNATLEAMAQTLFHSWFVDFDPVIDKALAAGRELPEALASRVAKRRKVLAHDHYPHLPEDVLALFPDRFVFSEELGKWVPEGWCCRKVGDLVKFNPESWSHKTFPDVVNYVDLSGVNSGNIDSVTLTNKSEAPSRARRILRVNDIIYGLVRPGNKSYARVDRKGLTGSTGFAVIRAKEATEQNWIYSFLTLPESVNYFAHIADGAAYPAIRPDQIGDLSILYSTPDLVRKFDKSMGSFVEKLRCNNQKVIALEMMRDTLLPPLISGKLSVENFTTTEGAVTD